MFQNVSILQQAGVAVLAVATAAWAVGLVRMLRRDQVDADVLRRSRALGVLPAQSGPPRAETVELTADERAAFAVLVRQFGNGRS